MRQTTFDRIMARRVADRDWLRASLLEDEDSSEKKREAFRLYKRIAKTGLKEAYTSVGLSYDHAFGGRRSRRMAVYWYRKAWKAGNSIAALNLGITLCDEGRFGSAAIWFRRAARCGEPDSMMHLARLSIEQHINTSEALLWLERRIASGPQTWYEFPVPAHGEAKRIPDKDYIEAKQLLSRLTETHE